MESVLRMIVFTVFLLFVLPASAVIYRLNDTEYERLPPLFHLEEFYPCLRAPGDLYCYVNARLVANSTSELLSLIQDYSAYNVTHYDHTVVHRGLCVTQSCRDHNSSDLDHTLEACLNSSLFSSHRLQVKLIKNKVYCTKFHEEVILDPGDFVVAAVLLWLLLMNAVGSLYDYCCYNGSNHFVAKLLLCFSTKRNWQRLVSPSGEGPDPKMRRLKCFNGIKTITTALVILGHSPLSIVLSTNNPEFIENTYHNPWFFIIYNGSLIVQTFFFISGFLLAYNILLMREKKRVGWETLPRGIVLRWLRLTPPYAVVLAFVSTWLRHLGNGPLWKSSVEVEVADCRREWYYNLLYLNNYIDNSQCMAHTWYLAADMQLTVLGLMIFCLLHSARAQKIAVGVTFVVGLLTPAIHTYAQNLHAILLVAPEVARNIFVMDPTFNNLYKRGHTNIVCYAYGMAFGMLILHLQNTNFNLMKYKKYRPLFWSGFPLGVLLIMSGAIFYIDGIQVSIWLRMFYASAVKLLFGALSSVNICSCIFKFEDVYRGVLEWRGWSALGRLSYCAYLVHVCVIRTTVANHTSLTHSSIYLIILNFLGILVISFLIATPCWMFIEAPCAQLVKVCLNPGSKAPEKNKTVKIAPQIHVITAKETTGF